MHPFKRRRRVGRYAVGMRRLLGVLVIAGCSAWGVSAPAAAATLPCAGGWRPNAGAAQGSATAESLSLDATIQQALELVGATPGLAVGILRDGEVIYARGFGVADLESCAPITPETSFYLLSLTKSFTGMLAALLQEEGTLELDQPLTHYLPGLALPAPLNPAQTSLRDLLLHRAGFFNGAINYRSFLPGNLDDEALIHVLERYSNPAPIEFRYSNMGYVIFATVLRTALGKPWTELLEERLFSPLGMKATTTSIVEATAGEFAYPYGLTPAGAFERWPVKVQAQMHAAGGVASNVVDLLRWVEANLEGGRIDGESLLPARVVRQAQAPQIQYDLRYGRYRRFAYGLGVHNSDLDGELVLHHFGGPIHLSFAPERRLGMVLLSAGPMSTGFVHELAAGLYDLLLERSRPAALAEALDAQRERLGERLAQRAEASAKLAQRYGALTRPAASHAGVYASDRLGEMRVATDDAGALRLDYGVLSVPMQPLEPDVFLVSFELDEVEEMQFTGWANGRPAVLDWGGRIFDRADPPAN